MMLIWIKNQYKQLLSMAIFIVLFISVVSPSISANAIEGTAFYMGEKVKKDENYKKDLELKPSDPHYGWDLGRFCISGFSGQPVRKNGKLVFLKNAGDQISLCFELKQNIDSLNGQEKLFIAEDKKAYDEAFHITKDRTTNFGRGMLLWKKTDYRNESTYKWYSNQLQGVKKGANTKVYLFEEGDYEVALDYQIGKTNINIGSINTLPTYTNYQIKIAFSVRNSNDMFFPFDVATKSELVNQSFTENGFYLDLANSKYLDISIVKQNYVAKDDTFELDTRFNRTATDGEAFTEPGIYTITVHNEFVPNDTVKTIYVGSDPVLKAYVTTGKDIAYIKEAIANGATISEDGKIIQPTPSPSQSPVAEKQDDSITETASAETGKSLALVIIGASIIVCIIVFFWMYKRKQCKPKEESNNDLHSNESDEGSIMARLDEESKGNDENGDEL